VSDQQILAWFVEAIKKPRPDPFTRRQQFTVVCVGHIALAIGVTAVFACTYGGWPSRWFLIGEGSIVAIAAGFAFGDFSALSELTEMYVPPWERKSRPGRVDRAAQLILLAAFTVQLLDVVPLLDETGGAIDSPFAQLTVVFAIFTPYVANNGITMLVSLAVTIVFYIACVLYIEHPSKTHAPAASYLVVNGGILLFTTFVTLFDSLRRFVGTDREEPEPDEDPGMVTA
jgi:hypothetical protein